MTGGPQWPRREPDPGSGGAKRNTLRSVFERVPVFFGSETENALDLAYLFAGELKKKGFEAEAVDMADVGPDDLSEEKVAVVITSTYGNGGPPANAKEMLEGLLDDGAPRLEGLKFAVLALGDRTYTRFCQCGKDFDRRLEELGGHRLLARVDCDGEFEDEYQEWSSDLIPILERLRDEGEGSVEAVASSEAAEDEPEVAWSQATVRAMRTLTTPESGKDTRHFEVEGKDLTYEVGDRLAVMPRNERALVDGILACGGWEASLTVDGPLGPAQFREVLASALELGPAPASLLEAVGAAPSEELAGHDVLDVLERFGTDKLDPSRLVKVLEPMAPRLYSIASTPAAHGESVHLTVGMIRDVSRGRMRSGVCSGYLERAAAGSRPLRVRVSPAPHFRLPSPDAPMIMIGAGTGLAPFRAFLFDRQARGATGENWLVFGCRHRDGDYLYRPEIEAFQRSEVLTRLSTAFSRDDGARTYVQARLEEETSELKQWLDRGAHVYICGDASQMAPAVQAVLDAALGGSGCTTLREQGRLHLDVY